MMLPGIRAPGVIQQLLAANMITFNVGSIFAVSCFSAFLQNPSNPSQALGAKWSESMGYICLAAAPAMIFAGAILDGDEEGNDMDGSLKTLKKTRRVKGLLFIGSSSFLSLFIASFSVASHNIFLLRLSMAGIGVAHGFLYIASLELIASWLPSSPGFSLGIAEVSVCAGEIIFTSFFQKLSESVGVALALRLSALLLSILCFVCSAVLRWPPTEYLDEYANSQSSSDSIGEGQLVSWKQLAYAPGFWLYLTTVFAAQTGYIFNPYYYEIGRSFKTPVNVLIPSFQASDVLSCVTSLLSGLFVDHVKSRQGFFSSGPRNMFLIILSTQASGFLLMVIASRGGSFLPFALLEAVMLTMWAITGSCELLLARELFGARGSAAAFGIASGIGNGLGDFLYAELVAHLTNGKDTSEGPQIFNSTYVALSVVCAAGLLTCSSLRPNIPVHQDVEANIENVLVKKPQTDLARALALTVPVNSDNLYKASTYGAITASLDEADKENWKADGGLAQTRDPLRVKGV